MATYRSPAHQDALAALADPTRRAVFEHVVRRSRAVGELAAELPVSRPAVSQHLRVLTGAGLVSSTQVGTRRIYRVEPSGLAALRSWVEELWGAALHRFKDLAEAGEGEEQDR